MSETANFNQQLPGGICLAHGPHTGMRCPAWPARATDPQKPEYIAMAHKELFGCADTLLTRKLAQRHNQPASTTAMTEARELYLRAADAVFASLQLQHRRRSVAADAIESVIAEHTAALRQQVADLNAQRDRLTKERDEAKKTIVCAYCGKVGEKGDAPEQMKLRMAEHVVECDGHPLRLLIELQSQVDVVLCDVGQLLDGWHQDGTAWSQWDETVRQEVSELHKRVCGGRGENTSFQGRSDAEPKES